MHKRVVKILYCVSANARHRLAMPTSKNNGKNAHADRESCESSKEWVAHVGNKTS